jgi:hypothetical protein
MKRLKKLNNPFFLGLGGFVAGAILFFSTHPDAAHTIGGERVAEMVRFG